jgi:hypothetical protein
MHAIVITRSVAMAIGIAFALYRYQQIL